jgi:hypothetical protein
MIGILCSNGDERGYAENFHTLFQKSKARDDQSIIVFTVASIDFTEKIVIGSMISAKKIEIVQVNLPSIIFNLSLQRDMNSIKGRKKLEEMKGITLINDVNRYEQSMIMDILYSSKVNQKYLLPYYIYNKAYRDFTPDENQAYITMPSRGASIGRVIYALPVPGSKWITGTQYFKKGQICDYIDASLCQSKWLFIEVPNLMAEHNHPIIVRSYMQKISEKNWTVLGRKVYQAVDIEDAELIKRIERASLTAINYLNYFLPSLGICYIDFIIDTDGNPYFLHFNGFEQDFFEQKQQESFYLNFYKNILSLAGAYRRMQRED